MENEEDFMLIRDDVKRFCKCTYMDTHRLGQEAIQVRLGPEYTVVYDGMFSNAIYIITRSNNG